MEETFSDSGASDESEAEAGTLLESSVKKKNKGTAIGMEVRNTVDSKAQDIREGLDASTSRSSLADPRSERASASRYTAMPLDPEEETLSASWPSSNFGAEVEHLTNVSGRTKMENFLSEADLTKILDAGTLDFLEASDGSSSGFKVTDPPHGTLEAIDNDVRAVLQAKEPLRAREA